ncbi:MAG TPA: hypothetical protein VFA72_01035 [Burkholderiales bacterium]|jgi:hypothetical protein|nr:hypothetical protein [Burkholderiales bacterium]
MKTLIRTALILALGGCTAIETKPLAREELRNAQGHVVGYKEIMRDERTGEELAQLTLFVPRLGERGEIVGYEERVRGGTVLRDPDGKRIGARWLDVRSRGSNPQNKGLLIVVRGKDSGRAAVAQAPSIDELIQLARLGN